MRFAYLEGGVGGFDLIIKNIGSNNINPAMPSDITNFLNKFNPNSLVSVCFL